MSTTSHTYTESGFKRAAVRITDNNGATNTTSTLIQVWGPYTISGNISGNLENVAMTVTGTASRLELSNSNGDYVIPKLDDGTYIVRPQLFPYKFEPSETTVYISGSSVTGVDFTSILRVTHEITATAGVGGTIEPSGTYVVAEPDNATFHMHPEFGYEVLNVVADGVPQGPIMTYEFTNPTENHNISVSFTALPIITLVDFGPTAGSDTYEYPGWDVTLNGTYTNNVDDVIDGRTITAGNNPAYSNAGVSGSSPIDFKTGDKIFVFWYNRDPSGEAGFVPRISFNDPDQKDRGLPGDWTDLPMTVVPSLASEITEFTVTADLAGTHSMVNIMCNFTNEGTLIYDKIVYLPAEEIDPVNTDPPASPVKLVFAHAAPGMNWLESDSVDSKYGGNLGDTLDANNYFVSNVTTGWNATANPGIGDRTDVGEWWLWFADTTDQSGTPRRDNITASLYATTNHTAGAYTRTISDPGGENEIVVIQSHYLYNTNVRDDNSTVPSDLFGQPANHQVGGEYVNTLSNNKQLYRELLNYFKTRPDKMFVVVTHPPRRAVSITANDAANMRLLYNWLVYDWLAEAAWENKNVFVFDMGNVLTDVDNHHRVNGDYVEHIYSNGDNYSDYYETGVSCMPLAFGNQKATDEFVPLLNAYYHLWQDYVASMGNVPPTADDQTVGVAYETAKPITLTHSDIDGPGPYMYAIEVNPTNGSLSGTAPDITYTPNNGYSGPDSFEFSVNDGADDSLVNGVVTITVGGPVNVPPVALSQTLNVSFETPTDVTMTYDDSDGPGPYTFSIDVSPTHGTLFGSGSTRTYTPDTGYSGPDLFEFSVNDGTDDSVSNGVVSLAVLPAVNTPPTAKNMSVSVAYNTPRLILFDYDDPDGPGPITFAAETMPNHGSLSCTTGGAIYTSNLDYSGTDVFTFKVNDGLDDSPCVGTVSIVVNPAGNAIPIAEDQLLTTAYESALAVTLTYDDPDGPGPYTFSIEVSPTHGTLSGSGSTRTYTPDAGYSGSDSFEFSVNDGTDDSVSNGVVSIAVLPSSNTPPTAKKSKNVSGCATAPIRPATQFSAILLIVLGAVGCNRMSRRRRS